MIDYTQIQTNPPIQHANAISWIKWIFSFKKNMLEMVKETIQEPTSMG